ncbi:MAG: hypothetical protein AB1942_00185 [Pseudomonadota bacterium]
MAPVRADVVQPPAVDISSPEAIVEPAGLRFHGWACRDPSTGHEARALRLERLDAAGQVVDAAYGRLTVTGARMGRDCATYDIPTDWPANVDAVRICVSETSQPCLAEP